MARPEDRRQTNQNLEQLMLGASANDPSVLDHNRHKDLILRLRASVLMLSGPLTEEQLTGKPKLVLEKPKALGATGQELPNGQFQAKFYVAEEEFKSRGLPNPSSLVTRIIEAPIIGLGGQTEYPITYTGDYKNVKEVRDAYDIPKSAVKRQFNNNVESPRELRQQALETVS